MAFLVKYLVTYLLVAAGLLAAAIYTLLKVEDAALAWVGFGVMALWAVFYFPVLAWIKVRQIVRLALDAREKIRNGDFESLDLKPLLIRLAENHLGMPGFLAQWLVDRIDRRKIIAPDRIGAARRSMARPL